MCDACDRLAKEKLAKEGTPTKSNEWKDIVKRNPGDGYGTREMARQVDMAYQDDGLGYEDIEIDEEIYHEGIKCFYCDEPAEWKCRNGLHNGCSYEGPSDDGVQVCGASSSFADAEHPEGHKTYANKRNNGHSWVEIDQYFTLDPQFGYKHGDHDPNKYKKR